MPSPLSLTSFLSLQLLSSSLSILPSLRAFLDSKAPPTKMTSDAIEQRLSRLQRRLSSEESDSEDSLRHRFHLLGLKLGRKVSQSLFCLAAELLPVPTVYPRRLLDLVRFCYFHFLPVSGRSSCRPVPLLMCAEQRAFRSDWLSRGDVNVAQRRRLSASSHVHSVTQWLRRSVLRWRAGTRRY